MAIDSIKLDAKWEATQDWGTGYSATVTLSNNTKQQVEHWYGTFILPGVNSISIYSVGKYTTKQVKDGMEVTVENPSWEGGGKIDPGANVSFGYTASLMPGKKPTAIELSFIGEGKAPPTPPIPGPGFAQHTFAPYVDVTLYPTFSLEQAYKKSGQKYYTLAFITADPNGNPAWGGQRTLSVDSYYFADQINYIRSIGGDVIVSFGGANGTPIDASIKDVNKLVEVYSHIIDAYKLAWIDFDVEGNWVSDVASIERRNQAIKILEDKYPKLKIAYCLPVMPEGLTDGLYVIQNAAKLGVRVDVVNIMSMDFGYSVSNMADAVIRAAESVHGQLGSIFSKSSTDTWSMIGITPMIGQNDSPGEVVSLDNAIQIEKFASARGINAFAMWSANRDNGDKIDPWASPSHSGIVQKDFEFISIFQKFIK